MSPSLNFQAQFADKILSKRKRHSIRKPGRFKEGDKIYFFTGLRTKNCKRLGEGIVTKIEKIEITPWLGSVIINGKELGFFQTQEFASDDGFETEIDFFTFFYNNYGSEKITMDLIHWGDTFKEEQK